MDFISLFMPRLDLMAQTSWLVYGVGVSAHIPFILTQTIVYSLVLVLASLIDLHRKQF
jgi:hypothetical protein